MRENDILNFCVENLDGVVLDRNWGERGIFYNPGGVLKKAYISSPSRIKTEPMIKLQT